MNWSIFQWRSLKFRMTFFTLCIFVLGIWVLAFYASRTLRKDMQRLLSEQQYSTVSIVAANIDHEVGERARALGAIALELSPATLAGAPALQALLARQRILQSLFNSGIAAIGLDGTVIAEVPSATRQAGASYSKKDYAIGALEEGKTTIGRPFKSERTGAPLIVMATPVRDAAGKIIAVLAGTIDLGLPNFLDQITGSSYGKNGAYVVVTPKYRLIITSSDKHRVMEQLPAPGVNSFVDRNIQGYEGSAVVVNALGVEALASTKRIPSAGWYAAVTMPVAEAFAPIRDLQRRVLLAALILTLLAGGLSWWLVKRQLSPMLVTAKMLATLSDTKQLQHPLPVPKQNEVGDLVRGFNRLLETLREKDASLRQTEKRYRTLVLATTDLLWNATPRGELIGENLSWIRFTGRSQEEINTERWLEAVHPDERADAEKIVSNAHAAGVSYQVENRLRRFDGEWRDMIVHGVPVLDEDGTVREWVGSCKDITKRKQVQAALQQERDRLRQILDSQFGFVCELTLDGIAVDVNEAPLRLMGLSRAETLGRRFTELGWFEAGTKAQVQAAVEMAARGQTVRGDVVAIFPRVGRREVDAVFSPIRDTAGRVINVVGFGVDITDRALALRALQDSQALLSNIVSSAMDAIITVDEGAGVLVFNHAAEEMFGCDAADAIGQKLDKFIRYRFNAEHQGLKLTLGDSDSRNGTKGRPLEVSALRANGMEFPVEATVASGSLEGKTLFTVMLRDIISRIAAADAERDALVREVHHRIKNNLQGVIGLTRQYLGVHPELTELTEAMIAQINTIAVVHGMHSELAHGEIDLAGLVAKIAQSNTDLTNSEIAVDTNQSEADGVQITEKEAVPIALILNELIFNATKHRTKLAGGEEIRVSLNMNEGRSQVTISNPGKLQSSGILLNLDVGLGTGLGLVKSLLPNEGASLEIIQVNELVRATLILGEPVIVAPARLGLSQSNRLEELSQA